MFENITKVDYKIESAISRYTLNISRIILKIIGFMIIVFGVLFLKTKPTYAITSIVLGLVLILYICLFFNKMINFIVKKSFDKSFYKDNDMFFEYTFKDDCVIRKIFKGDRLLKIHSCKYKNFQKVVEYENYIFMFINKIECFAIDKVGMINNDEVELIAFLKSKSKF